MLLLPVLVKWDQAAAALLTKHDHTPHTFSTKCALVLHTDNGQIETTLIACLNTYNDLCLHSEAKPQFVPLICYYYIRITELSLSLLVF